MHDNTSNLHVHNISSECACRRPGCRGERVSQHSRILYTDTMAAGVKCYGSLNNTHARIRCVSSANQRKIQTFKARVDSDLAVGASVHTWSRYAGLSPGRLTTCITAVNLNDLVTHTMCDLCLFCIAATQLVQTMADFHYRTKDRQKADKGKGATNGR